MAIETHGYSDIANSTATSRLRRVSEYAQTASLSHLYFKEEFAPPSAIIGAGFEDISKPELRCANFTFSKLHPGVTSELGKLLAQPAMEKDRKVLSQLEVILSNEFNSQASLIFVADHNCYECRTTLVRGVNEEKVVRAEIHEATRSQTIEAFTKERAERIRAERRLKWITDRASFFTHELRAPLTTIQGYSELVERSLSSLSEDEKLDKPTARFLRTVSTTIYSYCKKMDEQVTEIVKIFKATEESKPIIVSPESLLQEIVQKNLAEADNKVELVIEAQSGLPPVQLEKELFVLIQNTLVLNAMQAGATKITLRAYSEKGHILFAVEDNGQGMDEVALRRCLKYVNTSKKGSGIMLVLAKEIIEEEFNGKIMVESTVGKGTIFTTLIPIDRTSNQTHRAVVFND
ncbi:MAG: ATP-binding protein [Microgenomates group bacterium]|jgi:signal transduction histidine kinase